jgi:hypothetical protein
MSTNLEGLSKVFFWVEVLTKELVNTSYQTLNDSSKHRWCRKLLYADLENTLKGTNSVVQWLWKTKFQSSYVF